MSIEVLEEPVDEVNAELLDYDVVADNDGDDVKKDENTEDIDDQHNKYEESRDDSDIDNSDDSEQDIISLNDEPINDKVSQRAPSWVKNLRKQNRELQKMNRELQAQMNGNSGDSDNNTLPPKPVIADFDYDTDAYEKKIDEWYKIKSDVDKKKELENRKKEEQEKSWQNKISSYNDSKERIKVLDYDEAESAVQDELSNSKQGMIIQGADNPALVVYALGKNPKKLKELAQIDDPIKFSFAVSKLETQLKISSRKPAIKPEKVVKSSGSKSGLVDSTLEKLRAEAEKTGDYSKVLQYKKQIKSKVK